MTDRLHRSEELWSRLRDWHRKRLMDGAGLMSSPPRTVTERSIRGAEIATEPTMRVTRTTRAVRLSDGEEVVGQSGRCWRLRMNLAEVRPGIDQRLSAGRHPRPPQSEGLADDLQQLVANLHRGALFFDLETCGLYGSMIFLVGFVQPSAGGWQLMQLLARNHAEEKPVIEYAWKCIEQAQVLVSFNGRSFDWPTLQDRTIRHFGVVTARPRDDLPQPRPLPGRVRNLPHIDLLHVSRRVWRGQFPDFRLQTLERHICGRWRVGDVAGPEIPLVYERFVMQGETELLEKVLLHNALDLLTCVELAAALCEQAGH
ncbi:MAG: hypothetical protein KatS3mg110_2950 [Pirellulaceae bacterium]|nr:MAG: hypothetical protein KatS3mg110_2950 [Pirellulaceae bacterium]